MEPAMIVNLIVSISIGVLVPVLTALVYSKRDQNLERIRADREASLESTRNHIRNLNRSVDLRYGVGEQVVHNYAELSAAVHGGKQVQPHLVNLLYALTLACALFDNERLDQTVSWIQTSLTTGEVNASMIDGFSHEITEVVTIINQELGSTVVTTETQTCAPKT